MICFNIIVISFSLLSSSALKNIAINLANVAILANTEVLAKSPNSAKALKLIKVAILVTLVILKRFFQNCHTSLSSFWLDKGLHLITCNPGYNRKNYQV